MKSIFILDDSKEFIFLIQSLFSIKGVKVDSAISAKEARQKVGADEYDVLIIDYLLDGENGLDFIEEIRVLEKYASVPIVLLTAKKLDQNEINRVKECGAIFLKKPIQPLEFYNKLMTL